MVSKLLGGARVYATPPNVFDHQTARLRPVADAPLLATDATFLPGDDFVVIRTYADATVYAYPSWKEVTTFDLPTQQQGESITAPASGDVVWVGSEGVRSRVLAVDCPAVVRVGLDSGAGYEQSGRGTRRRAGPTPARRRVRRHRLLRGHGPGRLRGLAAALLVLLAGLVIFALTRRH